MKYLNVLVIVAATALMLVLVPAGSASAEATDAQDLCHAYEVRPGVGAEVGESDRFEYFKSVPADDGSAEEILCGNGQSWGAVHIEVKHRLPDWETGIDCMSNITSQVKPKIIDGKYTWKYSWAPGRSALVVAGSNGLITAYPWDGGSASSWDECARM